MKPCRECNHEVSEQAMACPNCGAPKPAVADWDGYGWEYKTATTVLGLPLIHISFKYRANRTPVIARGVLAIGQFGCGIINISQFGIGVISISQFTIAAYAAAQFAIAYSLVAQFGLYLSQGRGQLVLDIGEKVRWLLTGG